MPKLQIDISLKCSRNILQIDFFFFFFFDIQTTSYSAIVRLVLLNINYDVSVVSFLLAILYMLLIIHSDQFIVSQCFIASG